MSDYELYGGLPPHESSPTSIAAAIKIKEAAGPLRDQVLLWIKWSGDAGFTDDDLERRMEIRHQTLSARRRELVLLDKIVDSGRTRKTSSGRQATIWVIKNKDPEQINLF